MIKLKHFINSEGPDTPDHWEVESDLSYGIVEVMAFTGPSPGCEQNALDYVARLTGANNPAKHGIEIVGMSGVQSEPRKLPEQNPEWYKL